MTDDPSQNSGEALSPAQQELADLWERHLAAEFETKSAAEAISTMVPDAYVNHMPVLTGGSGHNDLLDFYSTHFIPKMPPDVEIVPISRTIGGEQIVDEFVFRFTHTVEMDWMLPAIPPTGKRVEVPFVVIIRFRGDKLAHEHIYWDQASVLAQLGLIDPQALPIVGAESARKALDPSLASNALIRRAGVDGEPGTRSSSRFTTPC